MKENIISIIIPIYNVEKYLKKCIDSITSQTYSNLEIILVDDGSPDNCGKICDEYAKIDKRIKVIHKQNGGLSDARNIGISLATGKYVLLVDSDDTICCDACEELLKVAINTSADMVAFKKRKIYEDGTEENSTDTMQLKIYNNRQAYIELIYGRDFEITAWSRFYKSDIIKSVQFPVGVLSEDYATAHKFFMNSKKIVFYDKTIYNYLIRNNSIMGNMKVNHIIDLYNISKDVYSFQIANFPEHKKKVLSLYINNLLKLYYFISIKEKNSDLNDILKKCEKNLKNQKINNIEFKSQIALFLYRTNKKIFMFFMKKIIKLR